MKWKALIMTVGTASVCENALSLRVDEAIASGGSLLHWAYVVTGFTIAIYACVCVFKVNA